MNWLKKQEEKPPVQVVIIADWKHTASVYRNDGHVVERNGKKPILRAYKYNWWFKTFGPDGFGVWQIESDYCRDDLISDVKAKLHGQVEVLEILEI